MSRMQKIADKMYKAKSLDTLLKKGNELVKCAENQKNDTPVTLEIIGPIFTNFGENAGRGPIPADKPYRILPKKMVAPRIRVVITIENPFANRLK